MESLRDGIILEEEKNLRQLGERASSYHRAVTLRKTSHLKKESARLLLIRSRNLYEQNRPLKWVCLFLGIVVAYFSSFIMIPYLT